MTSQRPWRMLPVVVLALVVGSTRAAEVDKYVPEDTTAVLTVNVHQLLDSAVVKKNYLPLVQQALKANADVQKNLKDLGFDPLRDLERVVVATAESCEPSGDRGEPGLFLIVHGRFEVVKIHAKLAELAPFVGKVLQIHKQTNGLLYEVTLEDRTLFFALPDRGTIVVSAQKQPVADALDRAAGKKKLSLKYADLKELIAKKTDGKQAVWVVATGRATLQFDKVKGEKPTRKTLADSGTTEVTGGFWVTEGVKGAFAVEVQSTTFAKVVGDALQAELTKAVDKGFDGALDDLRLLPVREFLKEAIITGDGKHIVIQSEVAGRIFAQSVIK